MAEHIPTDHDDAHELADWLREHGISIVVQVVAYESLRDGLSVEGAARLTADLKMFLRAILALAEQLDVELKRAA